MQLMETDMGFGERSKFGDGERGTNTRAALRATIILWSGVCPQGNKDLLLCGEVMLGGELAQARKPTDSVWWVMPMTDEDGQLVLDAAGDPRIEQPLELFSDLSKCKKQMKKDLEAVGYVSPAAELAKDRWKMVCAITIAVAVGVAVVIITAGAAAPGATFGETAIAAATAGGTAVTGAWEGSCQLLAGMDATAGDLQDAYGEINTLLAGEEKEFVDAASEELAEEAQTELQKTPVNVAGLASAAAVGFGGFTFGGPVGAVLGALGGYLGYGLVEDAMTKAQLEAMNVRVGVAKLHSLQIRRGEFRFGPGSIADAIARGKI